MSVTTQHRMPSGVICPIVTPLTDRAELDEPVFRELIDALVPDLDGLFVLGSSGELVRLRDQVADRVARVAIEQVNGRIPVYLGIGDTGLDRTLARAERFADAGADCLVASSPFYYPVTPGPELVGYFEALAERTARPLILYDIPQSTHVPLTPDVVRALAAHPRIVGIKASAGDPFQFAELVAMRTPEFRVLQGREELTATSIWMGADGVISAMGNFAPRLLREVIRSVREGRPRTDSLALQASVDRLAGVFASGFWLTGLKATLVALGWDVGQPSQPMASHTDAQQARVREILEHTDATWLTRRAVP
jgi:4-hydroxy-tetrahydrodipicolinate synthase